ncbi:MAG: aminopeptidase [Myxococcota bacterium]
MALPLLSGCAQIRYVAHVSAGQMGLLLARKKLTPERVARLTPEEQRAVDDVREALELAVQIGLHRSRSYRHLVERGEQDRVSVVVAAPADRLEPLTWCFPIVGRVAYRGYFDAERARRFAGGLRRRGYDTYVRPALLYSTLGWFSDPIPRELLRYERFFVVDTILHEVVHETIYVAGNTEYNESLATFIAHRGTLRLLRDEPGERERARKHFEDERLFAALMRELAAELERLYAQVSGRSEALRARRVVFRRYQQEIFPELPWQTSAHARFSTAELSNAYVLAHRAYLSHLSCFESELEELGGDVEAFVAAHRQQPGPHRTPEACAEEAPHLEGGSRTVPPDQR